MNGVSKNCNKEKPLRRYIGFNTTNLKAEDIPAFPK